MLYSSSDSAPDHMPWLHGKGVAVHTHGSLLTTLTDEMRRVRITPRARAKSPMPVMRDELKRILDDFGDEAYALRGVVFASLDPISIRHAFTGRPFQITEPVWNQVAAHITPEIIDAYLAGGNLVHQLPVLEDGYRGVSDEVLKHIIDKHNVPDEAFLTRAFFALCKGTLPTPFAYAIFDKWLANWPIPSSLNGTLRNYCLCWTILRLLAACRGWTGDDWCPESHPDLVRLIEMTRSAHGRLRLISLIPEPLQLFEAPEAAIARLASPAPA